MAGCRIQNIILIVIGLGKCGLCGVLLPVRCVDGGVVNIFIGLKNMSKVSWRGVLQATQSIFIFNLLDGR